MSAFSATTGDDPTIPGEWTGQWSENSDPRTGDVGMFVVHHAADPRSVDIQLDRFMNPNERDVSCTWFMGSDGVARKVVHPANRQWTTGYTIDQRAVTVETQNTSGDPNWGVSQEAHDGIAALVAWAAGAYGFPIDRDHVLGHREARARFDTSIPATACPGPSMNLDYIVTKAQQIAQGGSTQKTTPRRSKTMIYAIYRTNDGSIIVQSAQGAKLKGIGTVEWSGILAANPGIYAAQISDADRDNLIAKYGIDWK